MRDVEQVLRGALHELGPVSGPAAEEVLADVAPRIQRRRRVRAGALAAAAVATVTTGVLLTLPGTSDQAVVPSTAPPASSAGRPTPGDLPVRGVPDSLRRVADPVAAMVADPAVIVPSTGTVVVFVRADATAGVDRVAVVRDPGTKGLPGSVVENPVWARRLSAQTLVTDDVDGRTTYAEAFTTDGRAWLFAVTGADAGSRSAVLAAVVEGTLGPS